MSNHLAREKSPYLLQHADNPVDWYPWGEEAFKKAREENKPIFLSVGYATCHWCHVMAHESFEDQEVAQILNRHFISIKVDREERPDVDGIYMTVCQALTGRGGWPLSVFMTPDRKPFFAGTYFPKSDRMGMTGFTNILRHLAQLWENNRERVFKVSEEITQAIQPKKETSRGPLPGIDLLEKAYGQLRSSFDSQWGGFGSAPKFPTPHHLTFLMRWHKRHPDSDALTIVEKTLDSMRNGGIFDQVGFGFHRYSVDERWLVPHFEKMLYDQAMLAMAYTEAFQITGKARYAQVVREIFEYVLRDMTAPHGGFYSAEDADSEGEEGLFYVWTPDEVRNVLGQDMGNLFCHFYDISAAGNFEGRNIPHITRSLEAFAGQVGMEVDAVGKALKESGQKLFAVREKRIHPLKDDKILTSWNSLMIAALAKGYQVLQEPAYIRAASEAIDFILGTLRSDSGTLFRRYRNGHVAYDGYLDDYAFLIWGLLEVYESTFDIRYFEEALQLQRKMLELFGDEKHGGFYYTPKGGEAHILRDKEIYDGAIPSGNSVAGLNLLRLGRMTGNPHWEEMADRLFRAFSGLVAGYPMAYTQFLNAADFAVGPSREIVVAGSAEEGKTQTLLETIHRMFLPNRVLMLQQGGEKGKRLSALSSYTEALQPVEGQPTVYICENYACQKPITDVETLRSALSA